MNGTGRFTNIDGLRAVAALSVFWQHAAGDVSRAIGNNEGPFASLVASSLGTIDMGRFGVVLFFLISGFVVPFSFKAERPVVGFAVSRAFRLFPAFWLAVASLAVLYAALGQGFSTWTVVANMTMAPNLLKAEWMSGIYWTLFIELMFYFAVAVLFIARFLYRPGMVLLGGLVLAAGTAGPILMRDLAVVNLPVQYMGLHLSFLFSGLLLRLALVEEARGAGWAAAILLVMQMGAVYLASGYSVVSGGAFAEAGVTPVVAAYAGAIAVFLAAVLLGRPNSRVLAVLGAISYSIYLFHGTVSLAVYQLLPFDGSWRDAGVIAGCLILTLLVSWLVYAAVEKPGIALGRRILRRPVHQGLAAAARPI